MKTISGKRKAQISIFIIIAVIIISSLVFIITMDSADKKNSLNNLENELGSVSYDTLSENIDQCLEFGLRKAIIISGLKGGLIYTDEVPMYAISNIPENTYSFNLLSNLGLDYSSLRYTIVHLKDKIYLPNINQNAGNLFSQTIEEDFEAYLLEEVAKNCAGFEELSVMGFTIINDNPSSVIESFNPKTNTVELSIQGDEGDRVRFYIEDKTYEGTIEKTQENTATIKLSSDSKLDLTTNQNIGEIIAFNLDLGIITDVSIEKETITAKLSFPIQSQKSGSANSHLESVVSIPSRLGIIHDMAFTIIASKNTNKSLDLTSKEEVSKFFKKNLPYLSSSELNNINLEFTPINNSDEYKLTVYSIIDNDNKILGSPYVFRFGYENIAPKFNPLEMCYSSYEDECVIAIGAENTEFEIPIYQYVTENNLIDTRLAHFQPYSDKNFEITKEGNILFQASEKGRYVYEISVSDNEAKRTQEIIFLIGIPENKNNEMAEKCITINQNEIEGFPISSDYKNKIFTQKENEYYNTYAYSLLRGNNQGGLKINFKKSCLFDENNFEAVLEIQNSEGKIIEPANGGVHTFTYNNLGESDDATISPQFFAANNNKELSIEIKIKNKKTKSEITNPFTLTVYPSPCLGPSIATQEDQNIFGGPGSCCRTDLIEENKKNLMENNFILKTDSSLAIKSEIYVCYDVRSDEKFKFGNDIWEEYGNWITNLQTANIEHVCDGSSATGTQKISQYTKTPANKCEFCYIADKAEYTIQYEDLLLSTGFVEKNNKPNPNYPAYKKAGTAPLTEPDDGHMTNRILCEEMWHGSENNQISWINGVLGIGNSNKLFKSKGYCTIGTSTCTFSLNNPQSASQTDSSSDCIDWYYQDGNFNYQLLDGTSCYYSFQEPAGVCFQGVCKRECEMTESCED